MCRRTGGCFLQRSVDDNLKMGAFMKEARRKYAERREVVFDLFRD